MKGIVDIWSNLSGAFGVVIELKNVFCYEWEVKKTIYFACILNIGLTLEFEIWCSCKCWSVVGYVGFVTGFSTMTEPSKVIHVRNVGHEISEVCFCHSLFSMWIPSHPYFMFWNLILVSLACQKLYDCQNLLIRLNSRSPRSIEWIDMYDTLCMLIFLLMVITFINLLVISLLFFLSFRIWTTDN